MDLNKEVIVLVGSLELLVAEARMLSVELFKSSGGCFLTSMKIIDELVLSPKARPPKDLDKLRRCLSEAHTGSGCQP